MTGFESKRQASKDLLTPLPEPDGWAGRDYYHRPATTLADISKFELEQARYTADQMHAYSDAENAALREQVRVLRDALESIKHDSEFFSVSHLRSLARIALEKTK